MKHVLREKFIEALRAVLPLFLVVIALNFILLLCFGTSMPTGMLLQFIIGAVFLLFGVFFLAIGEDLAMIQMGERVGAHLAQTGKYVLLIICCLLIGALITIAEPNLAVFATLLPGLSSKTVIMTVAGGVGVFLVLSVLRVIKRIPLPIVLTILYLLLFALSAFAPKEFVSVAFDSAGVATGPITASFIMSVGIGLASVRGGKNSVDDSFGAVAICMIGPVAALLLLGTFGSTGQYVLESTEVYSAEGPAVIMDFLREIPVFIEEVALALLPIILFFFLFQLIFLRLGKSYYFRILIGVVNAFLGHTLLLTGVFVGFLPAGTFLGELIASLPNGFHALLIPAGMLIGGLMVHTEPAVRVLIDQVGAVTVGAVSERAMKIMLTIGVSLAAGLSMLRILTGIPILYFLIIGFGFSVTLSFIVPKVFTAIAFDSGGAVTGVTAVAFMLPFAKGACISLTGSAESMLSDAFGIIALVVMMPIIMIQLLGLLYMIKLGKPSPVLSGDDTVTIVEFDSETA